MFDKVAARKRRLDPCVDAVVLEISRSRMVGVEAARHALLRWALELVSLLFDPFDDAIERAAATLVDDRVAVPLQQLGLGQVEADGELNASWRQVEPVAGRALL